MYCSYLFIYLLRTGYTERQTGQTLKLMMKSSKHKRGRTDTADYRGHTLTIFFSKPSILSYILRNDPLSFCDTLCFLSECKFNIQFYNDSTLDGRRGKPVMLYANKSNGKKMMVSCNDRHEIIPEEMVSVIQ